ncbi:hypothetical protein [Pseudonocardia sp. TMWB2A]|uniref:hypothetical protein n=1 Tax=Pseudonocardia sp. TMWB2A TaxID=687430 RepID=UPI00307E10D8
MRIILMTALLTAVPVTAVAKAPENDAKVEKPAAERKICKREVSTGSIMARQTCHTQAEWAQLEARGKSDLERTRAMERSRSLVNDNR